MILIQKFILKILNILIPFNSIGDSIYINLRYIISNQKIFKGGEETFNDKLTKRMLSSLYLKPEYQITSCKYTVKEYLTQKGLHNHTVPTIGLIENILELEKFKFPDRCVVKSTAGSGQIILKKNEDIEINKKNVSKWFKGNHYNNTREKNYKTLVNKIIVEPFIFDKDEILDYKMFFSNGVLTATQVDVDRHSGHKRNFYDPNWKKLDFSLKHKSTDKEIKVPKLYTRMIDAGKIIAKDFDFVRVDFYTNNKEFYIGEITHIPESGLGKTIPKRYEEKMSLTLWGATNSKNMPD